MIDSTLLLKYSLRECSETIMAACMSIITGNVVTFDYAAIRLWTQKKQIKSHRMELKTKGLVFIGMSSVDELDSFIVWLSPRRSASEPGGALRLFSFELIPLQEISLSVTYLELFSFSPVSHTEFVAVDKLGKGVVFHVEVLPTAARPADAEEAKTALPRSDPTVAGYDYNPKKVAQRYISLHEIQRIDLSDSHVKDVQMVNENLFASVGKGSILLYTRMPTAGVRRTTTGLGDDGSVSSSSSAASAGASPAKTLNISVSISTGPVRNSFAHSGTIPMAYNAHYKSPSVIQQVGEDKLLIGFDDGTVQIIICSALQESQMLQRDVTAIDVNPEPVIAAKLCEFKAHAVLKRSVNSSGAASQSSTSLRTGVLVASTCPWDPLCGESVYVLELLTVGSDNRLAHWGVRQKDAHSSVTFVQHNYEGLLGADSGGEGQQEGGGSVLQLEYPMEVDLLGEHRLPQDPSSTAAAAALAPATVRSLCLHAQILPFETTSASLMDGTGLPVQKRVLCSFGGMLLHFAVVQPHRYVGLDPALQTLASSKTGADRLLRRSELGPNDMHRVVVDSCRGPDLAPIMGVQFGSNGHPSPQSTVLFLKDWSVEIVSIETGDRLQSLSTANLAEYNQSSSTEFGTTQLLAAQSVSPKKKFSTAFVRDSVATREMQALEGRPCCVHWCNLAQRVLVGFSTGGVGLLSLDAATGGLISVGIQEATLLKFPGYLRTSLVHDTAITVLITFRHLLVRPHKADQPSVLALVGDKGGKLSLWQMGSHSPSEDVIKRPLSSGQSHLSSIVSSHVCLMDASQPHRLLLTACALCVVKVWKLEPHGDITLIAYFASPGANTLSAEGVPRHRLTSMAIVPTVSTGARALAGSLTGDGEGTVGDESSTAATLESKISATDRENSPPSVEYTLNCVCGFADGSVESWAVSTSRENSFLEPAFTYQTNGAPVSRLVRLGRESGSNVNLHSECESLFLPHEPHGDEILCVYVDGTAELMRLGAEGDLLRSSFFTVPADRVNNVVANYNYIHGKLRAKEAECLFVSDFCGLETLLHCTTKVLPSKWHHVFAPDEADFLTMPQLLLPPPRKNLFAAPSEFDLTQPPLRPDYAQRNGDGELDEHPSQSAASRLSRGSSYNINTDRSGRSEKRQFVGSMESMQRIVNSELHFAKKDQRLLELFTQSSPASDGTVSPESTVDIVFAWLATDKIGRDTIWQLFKLLEIQPDDRLKFIEVAKIAAVVASAMTRSVGDVARAASGTSLSKSASAPRLQPYKKMRSSAVRVSYNSMGEKVFERQEVPEQQVNGIYDGLQSAISRIWRKQDCRVLTQKEVKDHVVLPLPVRLVAVPAEISTLLSSKQYPLVLPAHWSPADKHWFDPWRAIRIARALLDVRSAKQHEIFHSVALFRSSSRDVDSLGRLLVKHFQSTFGEAHLNVSAHKAVHFLEACLQYQHHPVLNVLASMLRLDGGNLALRKSSLETSTWVFVAARSLLFARGDVVDGGLIQPYSSAHNFQESHVQEGVAQQVRWQYVTRAAALSCVDEMLRVRGQFGPTMYLGVFSKVEALPAAVAASVESSEGGGNDAVNEDCGNEQLAAPRPSPGDLVDAELFLELLFFETARSEELLAVCEAALFGEEAMAAAVTTVSRDINAKGKRKLLIMDDDQDCAFGPFHAANMAHIKALLVQCVLVDKVRTGVVQLPHFVGIITNFVANSHALGQNNKTSDLLAFTRVCREKFLDSAAAEEQVSYIDFIATLLSWEAQSQGEVQMSLVALTAAIPAILRGIEAAQASELIQYLGCVQTLPSLDPLWAMGAAPSSNPYSLQQQQSSAQLLPAAVPVASSVSVGALSREGNWNQFTAPASDDPGHLSASRAVIVPANQSRPNHAEKLARARDVADRESQQPTPQVLRTSRTLTTVFGESLRPLQPLTAANITMRSIEAQFAKPRWAGLSAGIGGDGAPEGQEDDWPPQSRAPRLSYSRSVESIPEGLANAMVLEEQQQELQAHFRLTHDNLSARSTATSPSSNGGAKSVNIRFSSLDATSNMPRARSGSIDHSVDSRPGSTSSAQSQPRTVAGTGAGADGRRASPKSGGEYGVLRRDDSFVADNDSNYEHFTMSFGGADESVATRGATDYASNCELDRLLAVAEAQHRLSGAVAREGELEALLDQERAAFALRQAAKERLRDEARRELRRKEKESNAYRERADEERFSRNQRGRALADAADEAAARDRLAHEATIQRIIDQNRARTLAKANDKSSRQAEEQETRREEEEIDRMWKEDRSSRNVQAFYLETMRREAEERTRREQEEFERQIALLQDRIELPAPEPAASQELVDLELPAVHDDNEGDNEEDGDAHDDEEEEEEEVEEGEPAEAPLLIEEAPVVAEEEEIDIAEPTVVAAVAEVQENAEEELQQEEEMVDEEADLSNRVASRPMTAAERRMAKFLQTLLTGEEEHRTHPRRTADQFFMPQTFAEDILFDPFGAPSCGGDDRENPDPIAAKEEEDEEEMRHYGRPKDPFADIINAVKQHNKQLEKSRKALFSTSLDDVPSKDWMRLFRTGHVDWNPFFQREREALDAKQAAVADNEKHAFRLEDLLGGQTDSDSPDKKSVYQALTASVVSNNSSLGHLHHKAAGDKGRVIPQSLLDMPDDLAVEITPLPFGKVLQKRVVAPGSYRYFQVEVLDAHTVLTLEIHCLKGLADMYLTRGKLPSTVKFEHRATCSVASNRLARLTVAPKTAGTYLVAVHSPSTGAQFDLWAYASDGPAPGDESNPGLAKVTTLLRKFKHLAAHGDEELAIHFPRLDLEAAALAEEEQKEKVRLQAARRSVYAEMKRLEDEQGGERLQQLLEGQGEATDDVDGAGAGGEGENMEMFVVKAGRYAMRKEQELLRAIQLRQLHRDEEPTSTTTTSASVLLRGSINNTSPTAASVQVETVYDVRNPNLHSDLFSRPILPSRHRSMNLLQPVASSAHLDEQQLSVNEELMILEQSERVQQSLDQLSASFSVRASIGVGDANMMDFYGSTFTGGETTVDTGASLKLPSITSSRQFNALSEAHISRAEGNKDNAKGTRTTSLPNAHPLRRNHSANEGLAPTGAGTNKPKAGAPLHITMTPKVISYKLRKL